jgi:alpha-glucosidase
MLEWTRRLIALRNASDTLLLGTMRVSEAHEALLVLERSHGGETLICAFNLGETPLDWCPAQPDRWREWVVVNGARIGHLAPFSGLIAQRLG